MIPVVLRCVCPRCHGRTYDDISEFLGDHQGAEVRSHEVGVVAPWGIERQVFIADLDDGQQALVTVWPEDRSAATLAFRPNRYATWGPPYSLWDAP